MSHSRGKVIILRLLAVTLVLSSLSLASGQLVKRAAYAAGSNLSWGKASPVAGIDPSLEISEGTVGEALDLPGQSRWYVIPAVPDSRLELALSGSAAGDDDLLPANFDLALYDDLGRLYTELVQTPASLSGLTGLTANAAPSNFYAATHFPATYFPATYFPATYFPATYFPATYFPATYFPATYFADPLLPTKNQPRPFLPSTSLERLFPPQNLTSPDYPVAEAYAGVLSRGLLRSAQTEGNAPEIIVYSPNKPGNLYVRVSGRETATGAYGLRVRLTNSNCRSFRTVNPALAEFSVPPGEVGAYDSVILTSLSRVGGTPVEQAALPGELARFARRSEVKGKLVNFDDGATFGRVADAYAIAKTNPTCVYAKNQLATEIKKVVDAYSPQKYVVLAGSDEVIPFFRYPDRTEVANEYEYIVPNQNAGPGRAALLDNDVLSQDEYGARDRLNLGEYRYPVAQLPVGRLSGEAGEIRRMLAAYFATDGVVTPHNALVTGYDFSTDTARSAVAELQNATGQPPHTLISPDISWNAADLKANFLDQRNDLVFVSGHASAGVLAAADYSPLRASRLDASPLDHANEIYFGLGCHSLYNLAAGDMIPEASPDPDWARAFARQGMTAIGGTTYQYGAPEAIDYGEKLYLGLVRQLNTAETNPTDLTLGYALVRAKREYLANRTPFSAIHEKTASVVTLYGFPMLKVLTKRTITPSPDPSVISSTSPVASGPGVPLRLETATFSVNTPVRAVEGLKIGNDRYYYYVGQDGSAASSFEPILGLQQANVSVPGRVLKGAVFVSGTFNETAPMSRTLTSAPSPETTLVRPSFTSPGFYPTKPWELNYFDTLAGGSGATRLSMIPVQYRSNSTGGVPAADGLFREYQNMKFRLFYSDYGSQSADHALRAETAGPPVIKNVSAVALSGNELEVTAQVEASSSAGVQEVWVSLTSAGHAGTTWQNQWFSFELAPTATPGQLRGTFPLGSVTPDQIEFMLQAVSGTGLTILDANDGLYYKMLAAPAPVVATQLTLTAPSVAKFLEGPTLQANLSPAIGGVPVTFEIGPLRVQALTNDNGVALVNANPQALDLPLTLPAGTYHLDAYFAGNDTYKASSASLPITINTRPTSLKLGTEASPDNPAGIVASYSDALSAKPLPDKPIFFIGVDQTDSNRRFLSLASTSITGTARLGAPRWPSGTYRLCAYSSGDVPIYGPYQDFYYGPNSTTCPGSLSLVVDLTVVSGSDDGNPDKPGTLSYALTRAGLGGSSGLITFALPGPSPTIDVTGRLPRARVGQTLDGGGCGTGPNLRLVRSIGGAGYQNWAGLILPGHNSLLNLALQGFHGPGLQFYGYGNKLKCVRVF